MRKMFLLLLAVVTAVTLVIPIASAAPEKPGIPWENNWVYPGEKSIANIACLNSYPIDANGFVGIKDGHFYTKQGRMNFFGTNLTFDACFPTKELAEKIAAQLAGLGVNIVRLHHMDNRDIWGKNSADYQDFDADQMEKLDYLIYCLKQKGIYIDLNLHVSWLYSNDKTSTLYQLIHTEEAFRYGKGLDIFLPELMVRQKAYARRILTHVNRFTGLAYKDDPVMAMVEINNENSFYRNMVIQDGIDLLPGTYHALIDKRFQQYITEKYHSLSNLRQAWTTEVASAKVAEMKDVMPFDTQNHWHVQITDPQKGSIALASGVVSIHLSDLAKNQFFQFYRTDLTFKKDEDYTLVIEASGKPGATFRVNAMRQGPQYETIGLNRKVQLRGTEREVLTFTFKALQDLEQTGRITFADFDKGTEFTIHAIRLYHGKYLVDPLRAITAIGKISIPNLNELPAYPDRFQDDVTSFFRQVELDYWSEMIGYLKREIGVRAPITGTQIDYSFPELAQIYDYIDIHAYWQHPSFPGKRWDAKDYYVRNISMVSERRTTFDKIVLSRIKGKPFTISEYNHPYPNTHTAETALMLSTIAKLQDYDGIFIFNFMNNSLDQETASYFGHFTKFACKAVYPAAAIIFRDPALAPLAQETVWDLSAEQSFAAMKAEKPYINPYLTELLAHPEENFNLYLKKRIAIRLTGTQPAGHSQTQFNDTGKSPLLTWENATDDHKKAFFKYDTEKAKVYIGWNTSDIYEFGKVSLNKLDGKQHYFLFTLVNRDGLIGGKGRYVMTLEGQQFYDNVDYYDYSTKAKLDLAQENYGTKIMAIPTAKRTTERIENFGGQLRLRLDQPYAAVKVYSINSLGAKIKEIPFKIIGNEIMIELDREDNTIIYGIEVE